MTGFGRVPRRPDHWSSPHARARADAAERIDAPLEPAEAVWLEAHLAECDACRSIAAAYETDRIALRGLRNEPIEPPRDLWARTSAAIEREARGQGRASTGSADRARRPRMPLGAISGLLVVVLVVGATALRGGWFDQTTVVPATGSQVAVLPSAPGPTLLAAATPFAVSAGDVSWLHAGADGKYAFNISPISQVCPVDDTPGCAPIDDGTAHQLILDNAPKSVISSPTKGNAIVVAIDPSGQDQVLLVALPTVSPTAAPTPTPMPSVSPSPTATATPTASVEPSPTAEPSAVETASPSVGPSPTPTPSDLASATPSPSVTPEPSPSETPVPSETPSPSPSESPTPAPTPTAIAIATGVAIVGESASFSRDGTWFAFTARPAGTTAGTDIYVWHTGDQTARQLTTDGASIFASWADDLVVGSRPSTATGTDGRIAATTVVIDPTTGKEGAAVSGLWRPVVDPTGRYAVGWSGSLVRDPAGTDPRPGDGDLTMTSWQPDASTSATSVKLPDISGPVADFDVRWDETGAWMAIWVAAPNDATIGRLTLYHLDEASGTLERPKGAPTEQPALAGFSIGDGRLAWATPTGQDAQGSRVQVVAWSGDGVGTVETLPGEDVIVVR
jgi:Putative zinc-finger